MFIHEKRKKYIFPQEVKKGETVPITKNEGCLRYFKGMVKYFIRIVLIIGYMIRFQDETARFKTTKSMDRLVSEYEIDFFFLTGLNAYKSIRKYLERLERRYRIYLKIWKVERADIV